MLDQTQMKQLIQAAEQAWYACPHQNEQLTSPIEHENKRNVISYMIESLMAFKFIKFIKHDQTATNKEAKR